MSSAVRPRFAPDEIFCRWAWDRTVKTTDFGADLIERGFAVWRDAFWTGDPRRTGVVLGEFFGGRTFRWPWLEQSLEWVEREIKPSAGWPYLWRTPVQGDLRLPDSMLKLLEITLMHLTYRARDRENTAHLADLMDWDVVLVTVAGCQAEDAIARRFASRFAAGDRLALPPYFPGDRTAWRLDRRSVDPSPPEISRCRLRTLKPLWPVPADMPFPTF